MTADADSISYRRILLKISGEALGGGSQGIDSKTVQDFVDEIGSVYRAGCQLAIVCGGGNIFRGMHADEAIDRTVGDAMGMLATIINGLALKEFFEHKNIPAETMAAWPIDGVVKPFCAARARELLDQNIILVLTGGTGLPYFSTDTAAAMRALQIQAELLVKATRVDGVFNKDPLKFPNAEKFDRLDYDTALRDRLNVMDAPAIALCRDNNLPIKVFNMLKSGNLLQTLSDHSVGTIVSHGGHNYA
jgi:uridylate kinase